MKKYLLTCLFAILLLASVVPHLTYAADPPPACDTSKGNLCYTALEPLPGVPSSGQTDFGTLVNAFFKILLSVGALIAVGALAVGGITYMVSDVVDAISGAKRRMYAALWGLLIIIASYLILNTINPQLVGMSGTNYIPPPAQQPFSPLNESAKRPTDAQRSECEGKGMTIHFTASGWECR